MHVNTTVLADAEEQRQHLEQGGPISEQSHTDNQSTVQGILRSEEVDWIQETSSGRHTFQ